MNTNNYEPAKLKEVMNQEALNWRSTADDGSIAEKWNSPGTPVYYVLDPQGIIRSKWVGYPGVKALDTVLEKLIQETEKTPGTK